MSPALLALADGLFVDATSRDPQRLAAHYSPRFAALEIQEGGETREITRDVLFSMAGDVHSQQWSPGSVDEVELLHTAVEDGLGMVVYRWGSPGVATMVFTLVWDLAEDPPLLVRAVAALPPTPEGS